MSEEIYDQVALENKKPSTTSVNGIRGQYLSLNHAGSNFEASSISTKGFTGCRIGLAG